MARARAGDGLPRGTGLVAVKCCGSLAHLLEGQHAGFGGLRALYLLFQRTGLGLAMRATAQNRLARQLVGF